MDTEGGILRPLFEIFFTFLPTGYFLQILNVIGDLITGGLHLIGIDVNVVGF
ncbi:MAG: hypothetical protein IPK83_08135 [Planctomycetes bacterium]|nr:hypothetical protein [Planctomycetota bacterium]